MLNLDPGKLLVIAVVAVILLGPDKLPQVARQVGGAWRSFNDFRQRMESEVRSSIPDLPSSTDIARLARSPSALLNHLSNMGPESESDGAADADTTSDPNAAETNTPNVTVETTIDPSPFETTTPAVTAPDHQSDPIASGDPSLN
ncbi:MAG TPA: twin-arginine translocase TatA/TatE family subunit [Acidimicrobiales bacterium]|jgi:sec-independent protein translocase protein TatB